MGIQATVEDVRLSKPGSQATFTITGLGGAVTEGIITRERGYSVIEITGGFASGEGAKPIMVMDSHLAVRDKSPFNPKSVIECFLDWEAKNIFNIDRGDKIS
jgi:hypothetical protein